MWVGKSAYLTANPMTIQEGRRAIAQAVSDNRVKVRGPGCPRVNQLAQQPFKFNTPRTSLPEMHLYTAVLTMNYHPNSLLGAMGIIGDEGTNDLGHPSFLPLFQTVVSKVIELQYPWHLRCHLDRTTQMGPDILDEVEGIERKHV